MSGEGGDSAGFRLRRYCSVRVECLLRCAAGTLRALGTAEYIIRWVKNVSANFYVEEYRKTTLATGFHVTSSDTETATFDNIESSAREILRLASEPANYQ